MKNLFFLCIICFLTMSAQTQNVGIGTPTPGFPLSFPNTVGDKISLWGSSGAHYGFGIQGSLLQIHSAGSNDHIAFGYGSSSAFTETMRIRGDGSIGIGTPTPDASAQLDISSTTKGFLPPRITASQRQAITNPAAALMIWCTNCGKSGEWQGYNGSSWVNLSVSPTSVKICDQLWMDKNLDVERYRNGDPIPKVTDPTAWEALITGAWCYYNNDSATYAATYGKLYNGYAVNDPRGLAPAGWHIPSDAEWTAIETCLGGASVAGGEMKETGTIHWQSPNAGATNSSNFTGLPGGRRDDFGSFSNVGVYGYWWSSTQYSTIENFYRFLYFDSDDIDRNNTRVRKGFSVRCLRD